MKKELVAFEYFECLFPEEEQCLEYIIKNIQSGNGKCCCFDEKELNSVGLHLEYIHSLYNKKYISGEFCDGNTRGVVSLTAEGLDYFRHKEIFIKCRKKEKRKQNFKYWIPIALSAIISIISLIISITNISDS